MASDNTPDVELVRSCNWNGAIPIVLTLAPTSLGTTMMPHPIHLLLNRASYLHVGLRSAILRLHKFAPATINLSAGIIKRNEPDPQGNDDAEATHDAQNEVCPAISPTNTNSSNSDLPVCWLEDEESQIPLRWHLFTGVLFDMMTTNKKDSAVSSPTRSVPWRIRLHFSNYPSSQLLPLEADQVGATIRGSFKNSLKQALFLQYGNSKVAMNMSRQIHERLWDSIEASNYKLYQQINADLQASADNGGVHLLPIRLFVDSKPPFQKPCKEKDIDGNTTTLGSLLLDWVPDLFQQSDEQAVAPKSDSCKCIVAGIAPPMAITVLELWRNLCHPDHFLYIIVLTR